MGSLRLVRARRWRGAPAMAVRFGCAPAGIAGAQPLVGRSAGVHMRDWRARLADLAARSCCRRPRSPRRRPTPPSGAAYAAGDELRDARRDDRPGRHADLLQPRHARPARPGRPRRRVRIAARQRRPGGQGRGRREARPRHLPVPLHAPLVDAGRADRQPDRRRRSRPVARRGRRRRRGRRQQPRPGRRLPARRRRASTRAPGRFYGRDLRNTRNGGKHGPSPDQVDDLGIAWSYFSGEGDFTGTPVVARGIVVAGTNKGKVVAIDAKTGKQKWAHTIGKTINGTRRRVSGYRVFVPVSHTHSPRIVALDLRTGRVQWDTVIDSQKNADVYGSPTVWNGNVFMGMSSYYGTLNDPEVKTRGSVVALEREDRQARWKTYTVPRGLTGGAVWTTPAVDPTTKRAVRRHGPGLPGARRTSARTPCSRSTQAAAASSTTSRRPPATCGTRRATRTRGPTTTSARRPT